MSLFAGEVFQEYPSKGRGRTLSRTQHHIPEDWNL